MVTIQGKINLKFGIPEHGWLMLNLSCGDYLLELDISDVPNNPVDDLRSAILILSQTNCNTWSSQEVSFNLEPTCYYFLIERQHDDFNITISYSKNSQATRIPVQSINGTYNEILMPIYRALMDFYSFGYVEAHWPKTDEKLIKQLRDSIKNKKST